MIKHSFHVAGKLMLSGEWGILTPGNSCLSLPTRGINVSIEPALESCITSLAYSLKQLPLNELRKKHEATTDFLTAVFGEVFAQLGLKNGLLNSFHLRLENDSRTYITHDGITHKLGVGSSASTVVAIVKALALFHNIHLDTNALFNIAIAAHSKAQGNLGSGFDIAAAISGTAIMYTNHSNAGAIDSRITPILLPADWHIAVGFSGTSASTTNLINIFNTAGKKHPKKAASILQQIEVCVQALNTNINTSTLVIPGKDHPRSSRNQEPSIKTKKNIIKAMALINRNQELLHQLSSLCNNTLETPPLTEMIKKAASCGAAAKFSGAGGGDCVIALCPNEQIKINVYDAWSAAGFLSINELLLEDEASTTK
jgi:phosphomevalonate kinase